MDKGIEIKFPDGRVFKKFIREKFAGREKVTGLSLTTHYMSIARIWWEKMGKPSRINILFDRNAKLFKLESSEERGSWRIDKGYANPFVMTDDLHSMMPFGRYKKTHHKGFVFRFEK